MMAWKNIWMFDIQNAFPKSVWLSRPVYRRFKHTHGLSNSLRRHMCTQNAASIKFLNFGVWMGDGGIAEFILGIVKEGEMVACVPPYPATSEGKKCLWMTLITSFVQWLSFIPFHAILIS